MTPTFVCGQIILGVQSQNGDKFSFTIYNSSAFTATVDGVFLSWGSNGDATQIDMTPARSGYIATLWSGSLSTPGLISVFNPNADLEIAPNQTKTMTITLSGNHNKEIFTVYFTSGCSMTAP